MDKKALIDYIWLQEVTVRCRYNEWQETNLVTAFWIESVIEKKKKNGGKMK